MQPTKTPIEQSLLDRVVQGARYMLTGVKPDTWMSPGQPVAPLAQSEAAGRQFDFPVGINTRYRPREHDAVSFDQMRALADGYDLLRLVIETRKDQMAKLAWKVGPVDVKKKSDSRCDELNAFFKHPDQELDWDTWLRALLEDLLVLDAPAVYPRLTMGGQMYSLELVDGSTIKRVLDDTGRTPLPPDPAYQQIIKGVPAVNYTRDELIYRPRNIRTNRVYGYSPVEQVIMTVNIAMRRQLFQLQYYTEGNVPEMLFGVPKEWNPDQIKRFQQDWDSLMEGNTAARRHAKFVPGDIKPLMTKDGALKDEYDEWLARIVCFAFSIDPNALVKQVNRATAESVRGAALAEGLVPLMKWVKNLVDYIIQKYFGYADLCLHWEEEDELSPLQQMQTLTGYVSAKVITKDEAREKIGYDPMTDEQKEELKPDPVDMIGGDPNGDDEPPKPGDKKAKPAKEDEESTGKYLGASLGKAKRRRVKAINRDRAAASRAATELKKLFEGALSSAATRVAAQLADHMGKATKRDPEIDELLARVSFDDVEDLEASVAEVLADMYKDGSKEAFVQVKGSFSDDQLDLVNDWAVKWAEDRAAILVTRVTESTKEMLRSDVAQALEEGMSNDKLAELIEANYGFSAERSMTIARTETAYADIEGNLQAYKHAGVDSKEWVTGAECCDECKDLDGKIVQLAEEFASGVSAPPLHPNCRCDLLPILGDD